MCIQVDATNKKYENHLQNHETDFLYLVAMYEHMGLKTHLYIITLSSQNEMLVFMAGKWDAHPLTWY